MNKSIRQRQTMMVNWLEKTIDYQYVQKASSGSIYFKSNVGCKIRLSDHISTKNQNINVIFNPLNTNVIIIYKLYHMHIKLRILKIRDYNVQLE